MADWYVRSTTGNNGNSGASWALAKATILGATSVAAAGDRVFVSQVHAETQAASVTITTGSNTATTAILCVNDGATPPTALATTATATVTGAQNWLFIGFMYVYGITFRGGDSNASGGSILMAANNSTHKQIFEQCSFIIPNTFASSGVFPGYGGSTTVARSDMQIDWINCSVKFGASSQGITQVQGRFFWNGGGVLAGGSSPTSLFKATISPPVVLAENLDLSNCAVGLIIANNAFSNSNAGGFFVLRNIILPASFTGGLLGAGNNPPTIPIRTEMYNFGPPTGRTNYTIWVEALGGTIREETTLVRTGGLSDGYVTLSLKMVTDTHVNKTGPDAALVTQEWVLPNLTSGSSRTLTVEILHDSATNLKDDEVWVEINYPNTSANSQQTLLTDRKATELTAAADQTASSATWTTTGMANPNKQKLEVTFTPSLVGQYSYRVKLAKPSKTIYVDPRATIT